MSGPVSVTIGSDGPALEWPEAARAEVEAALARYPVKRSAILPVLWIAQREWGWLSPAAMSLAARTVGLPEPEVFGIATFYTMYNLKPVGRHKLTICTNLPCGLQGALDAADHLCGRLGIGFNETTADGRFTLKEGECMGACAMAPVVLVNNKKMHDYMTNEKLDQLIENLK